MAEHLLAVLFALASALALLCAVLWLRALAAYEDRSKAFERAAADCVRLEEALRRAAPPLSGEQERLLGEMRAFAESLSTDIGPMFGRDVVRLIDKYLALLSGWSAREKELLTDIRRVAWWEKDGPCWCSESPELSEGRHAGNCLALRERVAALNTADSAESSDAHAEHLREAREHQEEKHGE